MSDDIMSTDYVPKTTQEWREMNGDYTAIDLTTDPETQRMRGVAAHGHTPFDVPFISQIADNLWQGGCERGLVLPVHIKHVVSLYKWERYTAKHSLLSEMYVEMYDSEDQGTNQVDALARWINVCRTTGPVLVHCQAGLNRSSLVAARALWRANEFYAAEVPDGGDIIINHLREARSPACLCNPAFEAEVRSWT